jgi:hypothetical protein
MSHDFGATPPIAASPAVKVLPYHHYVFECTVSLHFGTLGRAIRCLCQWRVCLVLFHFTPCILVHATAP